MTDELREYIAKNALTYYIETYGCQMNDHDSERMSGILESLGYCRAEGKQEANLILFNTCCIREHAEARLMGNLGALKKHKQEVKNSVIGVCGCMMQQKDTAQKIKRRFSFVDMIFGTNKLHLLPQMLHDVLIEAKRAVVVDEDETIVEGIPARRNKAHSAYVNIIYGCNNFCTYCIVPYVRGRERSRSSSDIIQEIKTLCDNGVKEVTLLGQNVNSYGKDLSDDLSFAQLIRAIDKQTKIKRIRFMTSHPKDLTDELIECYGDVKSLCEHIHLPVQSGSNTVLKAMNRRYTRQHYLSLIEKLRNRVPDIAITTDIIVGFPGETQEEFEETVELAKQVGYDAAYTFAYSSRKMTKAAEMDGHIDKKIKAERLAKLNKVISQSVLNNNEAYLSKTVEVMVDDVSKRGDGEVTGRTRSSKTVNFSGSEEDIGKLISVKIDKVKVHTLHAVRES